MRSIAIYSQSYLQKDPRVRRQVEFLSKDFKITVFGKSHPELPVHRFNDLSWLIGIPEPGSKSIRYVFRYFRQYGFVQFVLVGIFLIARSLPVFPRFLTFYEVHLLRRRVLSKIRAHAFDVILANDISALGVCATGKANAKLVYDAHEYSPGQHTGTLTGRLKNAYARRLLARYLPACNAVTTVGSGIAELYRREFGVNPVVLTNAPNYRKLKPVFRNDGKIRLVHHGLVRRRRNLESMIDVLRLLDRRYTLDFYLVVQDYRYYEELKRYAGGEDRIRFNDPVPMKALPEVLNRYDIGIRFYPPVTLNMEHGLPNKFFEFIQARLAVAVGPSADTARYIKKYGVGIVSDDFSPESMASALNGLNQDKIREFKKRSDMHARELSSEANGERLKSVIHSVLETG